MRIGLYTSSMLLRQAIPNAKKTNIEHVGVPMAINFQGGVSKQ